MAEKEPRLKYAYYPGCLAEASARELDLSTVAVSRKLGIELVRLESAACCGAGETEDVDPDLTRALNARTLALAETLGLDILTVCNVCTLALRTANQNLRNDQRLLAETNDALAAAGFAYRGHVEVTHLLWILVRDFGMDRLRSQVEIPLAGLKVAPFYGCQILRPSQRLGFEDPWKPNSLEKVISALGAEAVDYSGRTSCCSFLTMLAREEPATRVLAGPLLEAKRAGANCVVTPCPMCHLALDAYQAAVEHGTGSTIGLPILHLPQLVGLAVGLRSDELGLQGHVVQTRRLVKAVDFLR